MIVYYCLIGGASALGALLCWKRRGRVRDGVFLAVVFSALAALSAVRYHVGVDYSYVYGPFYEGVLNDPSGALAASRFEPAFKLLCRITAALSPNYQTLFAVTSVMIMALVGLYYWLHSPNPFISVFLFLTLSQYYCSMNFLRQTLAAAIALYALPLARRRTLPGVAGYFAIVLLAASFHQSALILIPAYILFQLPFNRYVLAGYAAVTVLVYFNTHRIIAFVTRYWYPAYTVDDKNMTVAFEYPFTLALAVALLVLLLGSRFLKERPQAGTVWLHCAYFAFFFALMGTRHSIIDRLALYFVLTVPVAAAAVAHGLSGKIAEENESGKYPAGWKAAFAALLITVYGGGLAIHSFALGKDYHGVTPYQTVFQQGFYPGYAAGLRGAREKSPAKPEAPPAEPNTPPVGAPAEVTLEDYTK